MQQLWPKGSDLHQSWVHWKGWLGVRSSPADPPQHLLRAGADRNHGCETWCLFKIITLLRNLWIPSNGARSVWCRKGRAEECMNTHMCIHHLAKPPGSTEKELLTGLPQVPELGRQKLLIFSANNLNFFGEKMVPKCSLVFSLNYILEWIFICKKYFLSKRGKMISIPNNYSFVLLYKLLDFFFCFILQ